MVDDALRTTADEMMSIQCPDCGINWWLFPPDPVGGSEGKFRRCIECKRIYNQEGVNVGRQSVALQRKLEELR
jgi:DNA-directed RNA polymerase subunit RPC12/RpoP